MKKFKIGNVELENNVILAPMAGVTDMAFRAITKPHGAALMYTEMVSGKGLLYKNKKTEYLLEISEEEKPVAAQIFGHEPEVLAQIAYKAAENGAAIVDINMGCPAPKIFGNGDGSALMKNPDLVGKIVEAVVSSANVPVTVKIRKGVNDSLVNAVEIAKVAEQGGASAITVHGRTREQYYSGAADLDIIKEVVNALKIPVIGNGDICDGKSAKHMLNYTGCGAVMIGRAAEGNPWVFDEVVRYLETSESIPSPSIEERVDTALRHLKLLVEFKGEHRGVLEGRKHIAWYLKGVKGGAELRNMINTASTQQEMEKILAGVYSQTI